MSRGIFNRNLHINGTASPLRREVWPNGTTSSTESPATPAANLYIPLDSDMLQLNRLPLPFTDWLYDNDREPRLITLGINQDVYNNPVPALDIFYHAVDLILYATEILAHERRALAAPEPPGAMATALDELIQATARRQLVAREQRNLIRVFAAVNQMLAALSAEPTAEEIELARQIPPTPPRGTPS